MCTVYDAKIVQESGQDWLIGRAQRRVNLGSQDRPLFSHEFSHRDAA